MNHDCVFASLGQFMDNSTLPLASRFEISKLGTLAEL